MVNGWKHVLNIITLICILICVLIGIWSCADNLTVIAFLSQKENITCNEVILMIPQLRSIILSAVETLLGIILCVLLSRLAYIRLASYEIHYQERDQCEDA